MLLGFGIITFFFFLESWVNLFPFPLANENRIFFQITFQLQLAAPLRIKVTEAYPKVQVHYSFWGHWVVDTVLSEL